MPHQPNTSGIQCRTSASKFSTMAANTSTITTKTIMLTIKPSTSICASTDEELVDNIYEGDESKSIESSSDY